MRAARRPDAKYVRIDRTPDEAFRLDSDPDELTNLVGDLDNHPALRETERALAAFEDAVGGAWATADDAEVSDDAVEEFDEETQERLRDLGYLE
jgi:arylsulfatase A-like enzyme